MTILMNSLKLQQPSIRGSGCVVHVLLLVLLSHAYECICWSSVTGHFIEKEKDNFSVTPYLAPFCFSSMLGMLMLIFCCINSKRRKGRSTIFLLQMPNLCWTKRSISRNKCLSVVASMKSATWNQISGL